MISLHILSFCAVKRDSLRVVVCRVLLCAECCCVQSVVVCRVLL